jgi:Mor family transcriptional regulator
MTFYNRVDFITREKIVAEYTDGASALSLAKKYGFDAATITRVLQDEKVEIRRLKFDSELADKLREEYEAGATTTTLAAKYKTTKQRVCRYIREAGGQLRTPGTRLKAFD